MSNHSGSYMLNKVLLLLETHGFFEQLDQQKIKDFMDKILKIGAYDDCNDGEILEGIGERVGFCHYCQEMAKEFVNDLCKKCNEDFNSDRSIKRM